MERHDGISDHRAHPSQTEDNNLSIPKVRIRAAYTSKEIMEIKDNHTPLQHLAFTPLSHQNEEDQWEHVNSQQTQESAVGHGLIATVENFADGYLRKCDNYRKDLSKKHWEKFKKEMKELSLESNVYSIVAKLLTEVCIAVCKPRKNTDKCLAVYSVAEKRMTSDKVQEDEPRPDLVFVWTTYASAKEIICPPANGVRIPAIHWSDIVSYVEVKSDRNMAVSSDQASQYCHILPRAQPDLAGIYYSVITHNHFFLYWADTSGIVRSHRYMFDKEEDWGVLFRYISTLVKPLPELPTRDSTIKYNKSTNRWTIKCGKETYKNCELIDAACGQSRQTCVFLSEASPVNKRIVKDLWFDEQRRFKEAELLEKIKGVPGVAQGDFSADVPGKGTKKLLQTSEMHSGPNSRLDPERKAPRRTKKRCVLKSVGKKLKTRRSLLQIVKAIHDSLRAHQICFKYKRILHRDVSRYNILIDPEHYDVKEFTTASEFKEAKFLGHILDEKTENREDGILIDWDTAADLEATGIEESLAHRVGTPIYVARSVASGFVNGDKGLNVHRDDFPEMSDKAKALYIRAFGEERYERYRSAVNSSKETKRVEKDLEMRHAGFHDVESFIWVLFHELLLAWPENSEDDGLNAIGSSTLNSLANHVFGAYDGRLSLLYAYTQGWEDRLHPQLGFLAPYIAKIASYIRPEWAFWPELPEDHVHEALAIMLLEMACTIEENGDIELREEERGASPSKRAKVASVYKFGTFEATPLPPKTLKRKAAQTQCRASKRLKTFTQGNAQARPSNSAKANRLVREANEIIIQNTSRSSRKKKTSRSVRENAQSRVYDGPMTRSRSKIRANGRNHKQT